MTQRIVNRNEAEPGTRLGSLILRNSERIDVLFPPCVCETSLSEFAFKSTCTGRRRDERG